MPVKLEVVGVQGLRAAEKRLLRMAEAWTMAPTPVVHDAAVVLRRALRDAAPKRTGKMAQSIGFRTIPLGPAAVASFHASDIATFVIKGTRPHDIWAGIYTGKSGKTVLSWPGAQHPTPYVRHPGTKPNDFRVKAWEEAGPEVVAILRETGRAIVRGSLL